MLSDSRLISPCAGWTVSLLVGLVGVITWRAALILGAPTQTDLSQFIAQQSQHADERMVCASLQLEAGAFCKQDLPAARHSIRAEQQAIRKECSWMTMGYSQHWDQLQAVLLNASEYTDDMPPWSSFTPHGLESNTNMRPAPPGDEDAPISMGDMFGEKTELELQRCQAVSQAGLSWTLDRIGPFHGNGGYSWHSAGWPDCGGFKERFSKGAVWMTAFGFAPSTADGTPIGNPPLHIHHMHVSTSQSQGRFFASHGTLPLFDRPFDHLNVEFDIHGDRQCQASRGSTDCLIRSFPPGFGVKIDRPLHTFYDINDDRPLRTVKDLTFYTETAFRWGYVAKRPLRLFTHGIPSNIENVVQSVSRRGLDYPWHDDYLMRFTGFPSEIVAWSEQTFKFTGTLAHIYWHSHHEYTVDSWLISASSDDLGLTLPPYNTGGVKTFDATPAGFVNVTAHGLTLEGAMSEVLERLEVVQQRCLEKPRRSAPLLRCALHKDRFDLVDGEFHERYHDPNCDSYPVVEGEKFTLVSFHRQLKKLSVEKVWMHTVVYGHIV